MDEQAFNETYPLDLEGVRSADKQKIDRIAASRKDSRLSVAVKVAFVIAIIACATSDDARAHVWAILIALWLLAGKFNQILEHQIEIRIGQEYIKGALRDNRRATFTAQELTERRLDRMDPESADRI
ncbi:hypothetical protein [Burkholderia seminalis]|uniref:hypothetical protein n=1 Tax=Burkholderia seminalis TaxID=488731 RepID=UPI000F5A6E03|nr:hypothetical protein [Burkholderia seminalis]RQS88047.1 hypothetical protein DF048_27375 [Burkholderia seminalis]